MNQKGHISFTLNGESAEVAFAPHKTLLEVLREDLGLTGTKHGCELGECGTCTVLLDGTPVLSCLVLGLACAGHAVRTVEAMAEGGKLHPLQQPFADLGAIGDARRKLRVGVQAALAGPELPIPCRILPVSQDEHTLCVDKVRFIGDPGAAVAATSEEAATVATDLIRVDYEPHKSFDSA